VPRSLLINHINFTVVIAVVAVRMVQMPFDEIVGVIAVRNGFVAAAGAVNVAGGMAIARMLRRAAIWICRGYSQGVLGHGAIGLCVMQVAVVQVVSVAFVSDARVAAARTVSVFVIRVSVRGAHFSSP
jgi:hypothetical protein